MRVNEAIHLEWSSMAKVLNETEIEAALAQNPDWTVSDGKLCSRFKFADFKTAMAFVTMVAIESEKQNHHPTWTNTWNIVEFEISTHEAGDKVTEYDFVLAKSISEAASLLDGATSRG